MEYLIMPLKMCWLALSILITIWAIKLTVKEFKNILDKKSEVAPLFLIYMVILLNWNAFYKVVVAV